MSSVSVIIPTWNRAELVVSVLQNLAQQTRRPDQIVVVDNGSEDNTAATVEQFDGVELIRFPENRGFASAVNAGIAHVKSDWIVVLNNDVRLQADWLESCWEQRCRRGWRLPRANYYRLRQAAK